ncbi:MAG: beta-N-acetylhexosaminidase [Microbacterium sp.]
MVLTPALPLVPWPTSAVAGSGRMPLTDASRVIRDNTVAALPALDLLTSGVRRRSGLRLASDDGDRRPGDVVVRIDPALPAEGYRLAVDERAELIGGDDAGLFYGVQTLLQLLDRTDDGWGIPAAVIADSPRFAYRGVMLDVARHFFSPEDVKAYIDRAAALKFNRLHLHLTDDQGWRIEIDSWPLLTGRGAAGDATGGRGGFYTKDDYRGIVAHATSRHMTVVPEIDLPGHTHAVGVGYPELVEQPWIGAPVAEHIATTGEPSPVHGEQYAGTAVGHSSVRIHDERTYDFIRDVLDEVAELTPGPYLHIGGDECLGTPSADFATFVERVSRIAADTGKTPIAWHEAGAVADIAEGTIGQYWGSVHPQGDHAEEAARFVARGGSLILSPSDRAYLDMKPRADFPLGLVWAGLVPFPQSYDWEPTAIMPGLPAEAILGVEAPLWTETVTTLAEADALVFPRVAAQAEIAWSAQTDPERTWESFRARVAALVPAWQASGIAVPPAEEIAEEIA